MSKLETHVVISSEGICASNLSGPVCKVEPDELLVSKGSCAGEVSWLRLPKLPLPCSWDLFTGNLEWDAIGLLSIESRTSLILEKTSSPSFLDVNACNDHDSNVYQSLSLFSFIMAKGKKGKRKEDNQCELSQKIKLKPKWMTNS